MLNNKLKEMRERAGITQQELSEKLGITQQSVYYYEKGSRDIKASMLMNMASALGCTVSELLGIETVSGSPITERSSMQSVPLLGSIAAGAPI